MSCIKSIFLLAIVLVIEANLGEGVRNVSHSIVASRIVRQYSIYKVLVTLDNWDSESPMELSAKLLSSHSTLASNTLFAKQSSLTELPLRINSLNMRSGESRKLMLVVQGVLDGNKVFVEQSEVEGVAKFLSIFITANKAVFNAGHVVLVRMLVLTTELKPYDGPATIFVLDPDKYVIRRWSSRRPNVGVITRKFTLPDHPKVGFWTIRVVIEGQVEELAVKVETHYLPRMELSLDMPAFIDANEDEFVAVEVGAGFLADKTAKGNVSLTWLARPVLKDNRVPTPLYDTAPTFLKEYGRASQLFGSSFASWSSLSSTLNDTDLDTNDLFLDRFANLTQFASHFVPSWTLLRRDRQIYVPPLSDATDPFLLYFSEIKDALGSVGGIQIRAEAEFTEYFYNDTQHGFAESIIVDDKDAQGSKNRLRLNFLGPKTMSFVPGLVFRVQVAATMARFERISEEILRNGRLRVAIRAMTPQGPELVHVSDSENLSNDIIEEENDEEVDDDESEEKEWSKWVSMHTFDSFFSTGVYDFRLTSIPIDATELVMEASFEQAEVGHVSARAKALPSFNEGNETNFIKADFGRDADIRIGSYVVLYIRSTFPLRFADWAIMSKDILLTSGREFGSGLSAETIIFSRVVTPDMAPGFTFVVTARPGHQKQIVTDAMYIPVMGLSDEAIEIQTQQLQDHLKTSVTLKMRGRPAASFFVTTFRKGFFAQQGLHVLTEGRLTRSLHNFDSDTKNSRRRMRQTLYLDEDGVDHVQFYAAEMGGPDGQTTFESLNLLYLSESTHLSRLEQICNRTEEIHCADRSGCYTESERCDNIVHCGDKSDEDHCNSIEQELAFIQAFRLSRQNRIEDFYDVSEGDWGYLNTNVDHDGEHFARLPLPPTPDDFLVMAFSTMKEGGVAVASPVVYTTTRPIDMYCEAPGKLHRGESIGVRCMVINFSTTPMEAIVVLKSSEDYSFINVEAFGYVNSYAPRLSKDDIHHLIWLRPESELEVLMPVAMHKQRGMVSVDLELRTQILKVQTNVEIEIVIEGSLVQMHTSFLLDLKNRARVLRFVNVVTDQSPIIPYEIYRRYISGSTVAQFSLSADVIGPVFPEDSAQTMTSAFPTGIPHSSKGTEMHVFNLAMNTWTLHYLRLTNQWSRKRNVIKSVFSAMNIEFGALLRRLSSQGWYSNWNTGSPSVWLTAWAAKCLSHLAIQEWETIVYIESKVIGSSAIWLLNYQLPNGAFVETQELQESPLYPAMKPIIHLNATLHPALTAHVLLALQASMPFLQGQNKQYVSSAKQRAILYLHRLLPILKKEPKFVYHLCLTTFALASAGSPQADLAFSAMMAARREQDAMLYWSPTVIQTNEVRYEFNRPFLQPKEPQINDALAVEATAYALNTIFLIQGGGITLLQDRIVQWLNSMRRGFGGFISSVDSVAAMEALVSYAYHARVQDVTDLNVEVDLPQDNETHLFVLSGKRKDLLDEIKVDLSEVWGHVNVDASGTGLAVAQLDLVYGVDFEPFQWAPSEPSFELRVHEEYWGRNSSLINVELCFRWLRTSESPRSGMAVAAVQLPSGYVIEQFEADNVVRKHSVLTAADVMQEGKTIWYMQSVPNETTCFNHIVRRYFPVANLTRARHTILAELLRPERFAVHTFRATSLYILSICEVCGSFQCPFCPAYSSAISFMPFYNTFAIILVTRFVANFSLYMS